MLKDVKRAPQLTEVLSGATDDTARFTQVPRTRVARVHNDVDQMAVGGAPVGQDVVYMRTD